MALSAVQWVVGKALAPVADGVLEAWEASKNLGLNIEALKMELLLVQVTLETASKKEISGQAMEKLLQKLPDSAYSAEDLLDELDYFRIHDLLHGTYDAADQHGKGGVHDHVLHARHTAKAVSKLTLLSSCWPAASPADPGQEDAREQTSCCARPCVKHRARGNSSSAPDSNQVNEEVRGCMPKLGKFFPCSSSPDVAVDDETPKLGFNRVGVSERMEQIVEELQPVRREITTILQSCGPITVRAISQSRPITTSQSIEPKLYGRDHIVNSIIHDITKGKYCGNDLSVLPIVGTGGIGKTTLVQHIYISQEVQNYFPVRVWVCVSLSFDLNKLLEEIKRCIPRVEGEKEGTTEELIEQRLKSRRFLLVLDDIWECSNEDDWKRLLLPLKKSQGNGSLILVTTRFPAIAQMVKSKTSNISVELEGLELEEFQKLFFSFVFDDEKSRTDNNFLLETGYKIMDKLKGSPLAAKTVGRLLKADLSLRHWRRVLESKEWKRQTGSNDIMPALKLSYDYLPFHQQQCFSYSALFPEDHKYNSTELINFWMGLNILQPGDRNQTLEDIGLNSLKNLVSHGFFKEEETDGHLHDVMHDLLHDLALKVASHECLSLHHSDMRSVEIQPSIHHLSIIIDDVGGDNADEKIKSEWRKLKARLKVGHLQTLMLFGKVDESVASIFGDLFKEAKALRVLHLPKMHCPVESLLHSFSSLIHLRYLYLGTGYRRKMHIPVTISILYHLKILDLESCYKCLDLPKDMSNLALFHLYTPIDELHSGISNVGKLELLQELKLFRVHKESEGFELKQLEHLTELRELGIYNLEKIHTKEEAIDANLREKNYLVRLTLDWDSERANVDPVVEAVVLESLQPHRYLQKLSVRGHRGPSCPKWLGDELEVKDLQSLHLSGVYWEDFPSLGKMCDLREVTLECIATMKEFVVVQSFCRLRRLTLVGLENLEKWLPSQDADHLFPVLQVLIIIDCAKLSVLPFSNRIVCPPDQERNMDWFPTLQELEVRNCPEFLLEARIPWTETLHQVNMRGVKLLEDFEYSKSSNGVSLSIKGKHDLHSIDQVLASDILTGTLSFFEDTQRFQSVFKMTRRTFD